MSIRSIANKLLRRHTPEPELSFDDVPPQPLAIEAETKDEPEPNEQIPEDFEPDLDLPPDDAIPMAGFVRHADTKPAETPHKEKHSHIPQTDLRFSHAAAVDPEKGFEDLLPAPKQRPADAIASAVRSLEALNRKLKATTLTVDEEVCLSSGISSLLSFLEGSYVQNPSDPRESVRVVTKIERDYFAKEAKDFAERSRKLESDLKARNLELSMSRGAYAASFIAADELYDQLKPCIEKHPELGGNLESALGGIKVIKNRLSLLTAYPTLRDLALAGAPELQSINGIGRVTVEAIRDAFKARGWPAMFAVRSHISTNVISGRRLTASLTSPDAPKVFGENKVFDHFDYDGSLVLCTKKPAPPPPPLDDGFF